MKTNNIIQRQLPQLHQPMMTGKVLSKSYDYDIVF